MIFPDCLDQGNITWESDAIRLGAADVCFFIRFGARWTDA